MGRTRLIGLLWLGALSGCAPASIPLEEAKQIEPRFDKAAVMAPAPRPAASVGALLGSLPQPAASEAVVAEGGERIASLTQAIKRFEQAPDSFAAFQDVRNAALILDMAGKVLPLATGLLERNAAALTTGQRRATLQLVAVGQMARGRLAEAAATIADMEPLLGDSDTAAQYFWLGAHRGLRGILAFRLGRYEEAATWRRQQREFFERQRDALDLGRPEQRAELSLYVHNNIAGAYRGTATAEERLGDFTTAEVDALQALRASSAVGTPTLRDRSLAHSLHVLTSIRTGQGRWQEALEAQQAEIRLLEADPERGGALAAARRSLSGLLYLSGRKTEARALMREVLSTDAHAWQRNWNSMLLEDRDWAALEAIAERTYRGFSSRDGATSFPALMGKAWLLIARAHLGKLEGPLDPTLLDQLAEAPTLALARVSWRRDLELVVDAYLEVLGGAGRHVAPADAERLFLVLQKGQRSRLMASVDAARARWSIADPALNELVRQLQDVELQLAGTRGFQGELLARPVAEQDALGLRQVSDRVAQLQHDYEDARARLEARFADFAALSQPKAPAIEEVRAVLRPDEALLVTHVGPRRTMVWAIRAGHPTAFIAADLGEAEVAEKVARLRAAMTPPSSRLGDVPRYDVALAHDLYRSLLAPVADTWQGAGRLLIVADKDLGQLPFGVLVTRDVALASERRGEALFSTYKSVPWLIREAAIAQIPAPATLVALRTQATPRRDRAPFIGFGDPWFTAEQAAEAQTPAGRPVQLASAEPSGPERIQQRSSPKWDPHASTAASLDMQTLTMRGARGFAVLPRLPDTGTEIREIAAALGSDPDRSVFLGTKANVQAVLEADLSRYRVIAFATHGLVPGELDGLTQPALALTPGAVTGLGDDGLLTMGRIMGLRLDADWVVLSACNTAAGDGEGAEAISGLGRAFFYAGARSLLITHWPVETTSARLLTTGLFRRDAADPALPRAEALRQAELALIDAPGDLDPATGRVRYSYAHPLFWAPYALIGDGGTALATR